MLLLTEPAEDILRKLRHLRPGDLVVYGKSIPSAFFSSVGIRQIEGERAVMDLVFAMDSSNAVMRFQIRTQKREFLLAVRGVQPEHRQRLEEVLKRVPHTVPWMKK